MRKILEIEKQLLPDLMEILKKRYEILHQIKLSELVGRRTLATSLEMTERVLRAETDLLKTQGLIEIESAGMRLSSAGEKLLEDLESIVKELFGLTNMEERIRKSFGLQQVLIVPGDSDRSPLTKRDLGLAACKVLRKVMGKDDVVALTGGSTLAQMAEQMTSTTPMKSNWFVPARGGLGESLDYQANTIASKMAQRVGAQYRLLHVPDLLSEEAYQSLMQEPNILEIVEFIRKSRIVVHGIGDAFVMAKRRRVDQQTVDALRQEGALAEAYGYYFDRQGNVVHKMVSLGLRLEEIQEMEVVIAIAGGASKGEAIHSVLKFGQENVLIIDEGAALEIIRLMDEEEQEAG
ncbi:sugar-binding transcriptional regulator [Paenibacillus guangzhouensis]|uniref:sugar-binding transcriptional regulator n=1 Tax=Paenibacillus guangzhouensis TaxID=1473112 RepID=UPI00126757D2|nr:sugar-binding domain-containing protein [Paenibacillus guangzhouensis]